MQDKYYTYVLYSETYDKIYIGYTSDINKRLESHNSTINKGWTRKYQPWKLVYFEECDTKIEAMTREKALKSFKGREFIRNQILKAK
jgi:putative endonuclease